MKLSDVDRDICIVEGYILQELIDIETGRCERNKPHDKRYWMELLARHKKTCQTCQGVKLADQLFGGKVVVDG